MRDKPKPAIGDYVKFRRPMWAVDNRTVRYNGKRLWLDVDSAPYVLQSIYGDRCSIRPATIRTGKRKKIPEHGIINVPLGALETTEPPELVVQSTRRKQCADTRNETKNESDEMSSGETCDYSDSSKTETASKKQSPLDSSVGPQMALPFRP